MNSERRNELIRFIRGKKDCGELKVLVFCNFPDRDMKQFRDGSNGDPEYLHDDGRWISKDELLDPFGDCRDNVMIIHIVEAE
jgi:hypothetical protein